MEPWNPWHRSAFTSTSRSAPRSATTAISIAACTMTALRRRYVDALVADIRALRRPGDRRRHDLLRRRHAVAARAGGGRPDHRGLPRHASTWRPTPRSRSKPIPRSSTAETLDGFRAAGVNRLSFGVQSFRDEELRRLGRLHSSADGARRGAAGAGGGLRQPQPRPDDVAAGAAAPRSGWRRSTR